MRVVLVPGAGIEPARLAAGGFESPASTNFTTRAILTLLVIKLQPVTIGRKDEIISGFLFFYSTGSLISR